jgi:hypothetical protein
MGALEPRDKILARMKLQRLAWLVTALITTVVNLPGQTITASLSGTVRDPAGAAVPGATVRIVSTTTNVETAVTTNAEGIYQAPSLPAGTYTVRAGASGFKTAVRNDVVLEVSQQATLDINLEVGSVSESVDVTAHAEVVDATTSSVGDVVDHAAIENLPMIDRNPYSLIFLVPGTNGSVGLTYNSDNISANGGRPGSAEILIDGSASSPPGANPINILTIFPSVDALQEFRVQTSTYSAEFGKSGGGIVNMVFKSGTNQVHGTMFEFLRNSILDANSFYNNLNGIPLQDYRKNQFGASIGGPVVLPRFFNGRNKLFFFGDYEGRRQGSPTNLKGTVPSDLQRAGDFSQTYAQSGQKVTIYDPLTTVPSTGTTYVRSAFPGNLIPASRMDPVGRAVMKYYPTPTSAGNQYTAANNYYAAGVQRVNIDQFDVKADEYLNDSNRVNFRVSRRWYTQPNPENEFPADLIVASSFNALHQIATSMSTDYSHNFGPTLLSELRLSFSRTLRTTITAGTGFNPTQLGMPSYIAAGAQLLDFPGIAAANFMTIGDGGAGYVRDSFNSYNVLQSNSKVWRDHVIKFGWEGRKLVVATDETSSPDGNFNFTAAITQGPNPATAANTAGNSLAGLLLGVGSTGSMVQNYKISNTSSYYYAWYLADDWKISPKLTLNLGLRYEVQVPRTEEHNRMNYFDPSVPSPLAGPSGIPGLRGGIVFVGVNGHGPRQFPTNWDNLAPRFGFAYRVDSKTVLRGGGGIFYAPSPVQAGGTIGNYGWATTTTYTGSVDGLTPTSYISNPFPTGFAQVTGSSQGLMTLIGQAIDEPLPAPKSTYTENWSMGIQREMPFAVLVDATYVGNHGVQLIENGENTVNLNQLTPQQVSQGASLLNQVPNPFYGLITVGTLATKTVPAYFLLRPFPQFTSVGPMFQVGGNSSYNSLQVKATKRFHSGVTFILAYTKQKLIDDNSIISNVGTNASSENIYCRKCDRSVSANDVAQILTLNGVYQLPVGRGRRFGSGMNRALDFVVGGWQMSGILQFRSGLPLNILSGNNNTLGSTNAGNSSQRPDNNGHTAYIGGPVEDRLNKYFDTSVFSQPAAYTFGNTGRTLPDVRGPGVRNLDFAVFKSFRYRERLTAQLRGEAFNATNTVQFSNPNITRNSNQFGIISNQANSPRQMQVGLKLLF